MITTDLPHRTEMTIKAMVSVDRAGSGTFDYKVLSIDRQVPSSQENELAVHDLGQAATRLGWAVVTGECTGHRAMLNNIQRGLSYIDQDNLFYCEDHVFVEHVPSVRSLDFLTRYTPIRWICYNTHVHQENLLGIPGFVERPDRQQRLDFINDPMNWMEVGGEPIGEEFLIKGPPIHDEYHLNFPVAIAPTGVFTDLMQYGLSHYSDIGIEIGFTRAWFDLQYDRNYKVAIITKYGTRKYRPFRSFSQMHECACMRFRNNDPSMIHPSVVPHQSVPQQSNQKRSFF